MGWTILSRLIHLVCFFVAHLVFTLEAFRISLYLWNSETLSEHKISPRKYSAFSAFPVQHLIVTFSLETQVFL